MEEKNKENALNYEQLKNVAGQLSAQVEALNKENIQLKQLLQQSNLSNLYTELNFKFRALECADKFDKEFITSIIKDIQNIMTPPKEEDKGDNKEESNE